MAVEGRSRAKQWIEVKNILVEARLPVRNQIAPGSGMKSIPPQKDICTQSGRGGKHRFESGVYLQ